MRSIWYSHSVKPRIFEKLSSLRYVDAFVKEVLRVHPISLMDGRKTAQDLELTTSEGLTIAFLKGIQVFVHAGRVHQSKKYWGEDATEFKPERWITENGEFVNVAGSYIPFCKFGDI
ncbi:hypothetical protein HK098_003866 [Nowakowskiella sp. JEL0407]|nr:hypothetical protein HK098_003866 [Nowakowskiella sp. JEL0407]